MAPVPSPVWIQALVQRQWSSKYPSLGRTLLTIHRSLQSTSFDISSDIRSEIRSARDDANRCRIIAWLLKDIPDPSTQHNVARDDHEASTGAWLMEADEFKTWVSGKNSFLWLNGGGASSF
jgi:hypothetical protein